MKMQLKVTPGFLKIGLQKKKNQSLSEGLTEIMKIKKKKRKANESFLTGMQTVIEDGKLKAMA